MRNRVICLIMVAIFLLPITVACGHSKYYQVGYASWYGKEFQGRRTASGEKFSKRKKTAAHRNLPFGTVVKVTNLENGKTVKVRINDRGPYKDGRVIDLSRKAFKNIADLDQGKVRVGIKIKKKP